MKGVHQEPRSTSSCAACKFLKRRCTPTCLFAPYFRSSDDPTRFAKVHKVFGASNVAKILAEVPEDQRHDTVNSLVYEAEARLRDPVYGCIGAIALLQSKMAILQHDLALARSRLARYAAVDNGVPPVVFLEENPVVPPLWDISSNTWWAESLGLESQSGPSLDELSQIAFP
ncbi:hypothetical protein NMG60_11018362 [Bertholletia excelsa]